MGNKRSLNKKYIVGVIVLIALSNLISIDIAHKAGYKVGIEEQCSYIRKLEIRNDRMGKVSKQVIQETIEAFRMKPTVIKDSILEYEPFEEDGSMLMIAESLWRGLAYELQELHYLKGAQFINQLKLIVYYGEFHPIEGETDIFSAISDYSEDFNNLMKAARKAVEHGYRVYILPNPKGIRTADYISERKGVYKMFDLKTITGKNSIDNRLLESIDQTNRVLLHMTTDYNPWTLVRSIKRYFKLNPNALEVLIYKGKKEISVTRKSLDDTNFFRTFIRRYTK